MDVKGLSTGFVPKRVKNRNTIEKLQKKNVFFEVFWFCIDEGLISNLKKIKIDIKRAITPPSLLGIARKMAYAKRKYHSGWICVGVISGFAGVKLSGSISKKGFCKLR